MEKALNAALTGIGGWLPAALLAAAAAGAPPTGAAPDVGESAARLPPPEHPIPTTRIAAQSARMVSPIHSARRAGWAAF
jgi:hypothetical protein